MIEVTPSMLEAGIEKFYSFSRYTPIETVLKEVYRAMVDAKPEREELTEEQLRGIW